MNHTAVCYTAVCYTMDHPDDASFGLLTGKCMHSDNTQ